MAITLIGRLVDAGRVTQHYGQWLSLIVATMSTSFVGGTSVQTIGGTEDIDCPIRAVFDAATTITSQEFQIQVSDDNTNWTGIPSVRATTGAALVTHSIATSTGTVRDRLLSTNHRNAKYVRMAAKYTGGAPAGVDAQQSDLNYSLIWP